MKRIISFSLVLIMLSCILAGCGFIFGDNTTVNVNFYVDGQLYTSKTVNLGDTVSMPTAPEKKNQIFVGWYTDGIFSQEFDFSSSVIFNTDLYAYFTIDGIELTNYITANTMKSIVTVVNKSFNSGFFGAETSSVTSQGSGVIVDISGGWCYVLTNSHVAMMEEGYDYQTITVEDLFGNVYEARIYQNGGLSYKAISEEYDLALICFEYAEAELAEISVGSDPAVGDYVVSLGTPEGQKNAITYGSALAYSSVNANEDDSISNVTFDVILHDAPIEHGSSGGALLNTEGKLVGLNFAGYGDGRYGCAIPMSKINEFLNKYVYNR